MLNRAFNLTAAARSLEANPDAKVFVNAVKKFQSAVSVSLDLAEVKQSVDELRRLKENSGGEGTVVRALLVHAVIVYSRATETSALDRYNVGVTGAYSEKTKKLHRQIVDLRNKAIAHFGWGNGWYDESVLYLEQSSGNAITAVHQRTNSDSLVFDALSELLEIAIPYVKGKEKDRAMEINDELARSPHLFDSIEGLPFDVEAFFRQDPRAAAQFWRPTAFTVEQTIKNPDKNGAS